MKFTHSQTTHNPTLAVSLIPILVLLISLAVVILTRGASDVLSMGYKLLLGASAVCVALTMITTTRRFRVLMLGVRKSVRQIFPAVPVLLFIGTVGATWMLSGVVPGMIYYGVNMLNPVMFLFLACSISAVVSVMSGTSWTTIATIGVAFMGIGTVMGYDEAWIAGAVISGAYFGDKVSPLSDTTVLAASSTGVKLFSHIRSLMVTTVPAMAIALAVFACVGLMSGVSGSFDQTDICDAITSTFNISPWLALVPLLTIALLAMRAGTTLTLAVSSGVALAVMYVCQPQIVGMLAGDDGGVMAMACVGARVLFSSTEVSTGSAMLDPLVATGGVAGMLPTVYLVGSAMIFGGVMLGSGMLGAITKSFARRLKSTGHLVGATVGSGLFLNSATGDQYLSIIIGSNLYRNIYRRLGERPQLLGRALEDSISVTSVLIPWNSCGMAQSTVLGVSTLAYAPMCVFNYLSPLMSVAVAYGIQAMRHRARMSSVRSAAVRGL